MAAAGLGEPVGQQAAEGTTLRRVILTPGLAAVVLLVLVVLLLGRAIDLLLLLFLAILIAVYLGAFTDAVVGRTKWPRPAAFAVAIGITILALWGIEALLVPPVIEQTRQLIASLPRYIGAWQDWLGRLVERFPALDPFVGGERKQEVVDAVLAQAESLMAGVVPQMFNLVHGVINVVSVLVMAIYFARAPQLYVDLVVSLTPPRHRAAARDVLVALGATLRSWVFAQIFNMAVLGILSAIGLWVLDVPYWLAFGIFAGLAAIVPFFGTLVSSVLPAFFVLDQGPTQFVLVILLGFVVHIIEANVIAPMIFQRGVKLPPVLTIMSVLIVGSLLGPAGLLVAVPTLAVLLVLTRKILQERVYLDVADLPPGDVVQVAVSPKATPEPPAAN